MIKTINMKNCASYDNEGISICDCNRVNYIYGHNGSGKSTISNYLQDHSLAQFCDCSIEWELGTESEVHVYNKTFRQKNLQSMPGVFTLGEATAEQIKHVKDYRGTCLTRHYIRADAVEAVVAMELQRLAEYLIADENRFAEILARRSIKQVESEKKTVQSELRKSEMRIEIIPKLLKTLYEDRLSGKTSEDNYCVLSQEYSDEREQLQKKILKLRRKLTEMGEKENEREEFIHAIRKFMEMRTLTKQVLNELIDHIDVYETQGTGKNKTQRLVIYYKFVGYLDIDPTQCHPNYTADIREGVAIEYVSCEPSDSLKELFPEGYGACDDSFEEAKMEQA